jgi:ATP-dependent exoDNAse (exonuclease V) alpha subunit
MFITGKAGTGKSTLLKLLVEKTSKRVALLAPTGLAAVNVGGETIHSFFRFPPRPIDPDEIKSVPDKRLYQAIDAILIDEVSMVRADLMDSIDRFMRKNGRGPGQPFGGAQVLFFGDVYQLPPVVASGEEAEFLTDHYGSEFFFDAEVFRGLRLEIVELTQVFRQTDPAFIRVLDAFRTGEVTQEDAEIVNRRYRRGLERMDTEGHIVLTTTNAAAGEINMRRLSRLAGPERVFEGTVAGEYPRRAFPTDPELHLRVGAQVMFVKNDTNRRWVNGTLGIVAGMEANSVEVRFPSNGGSRVVQVGHETWEILKHRYNKERRRIETQVVGAFTQIPLKLAWAVTIHKSQGLTFDKVVIDLGQGAFAYGQTYVALSRCRTLEGILLKRPISQNDIKVHPRIASFLEARVVHRPRPPSGRDAASLARGMASQGRVREMAEGERSEGEGASDVIDARRRRVCPHGVPRPYTCAICEPDRFREMTGIG